MTQIVPDHLYLTPEEKSLLLQKDDLKAWVGILSHLAWLAFAFGLVYYYPNVLTIIIALFIIGGKQLACAILMHDASHHAVFKSKRLNDILGQWLGAYPIFNNMKAYRPYHFDHHLSNGLEEDPDLLLTRGYPTSRASMIRKFIRDLSGITGIRVFFGLILIHLGYLEYNLGNKVTKIDQSGRSVKSIIDAFFNNLFGPLMCQILIFVTVAFFTSPWLYLLWIGAYLTTFQFSLRVRSIAEHSISEDQKDPYKNTRTTKANFLEQLLFAPFHVNYHSEHHMLMSVPSYHLKPMHLLLLDRGFYKKGVLAANYWEVLKKTIV